LGKVGRERAILTGIAHAWAKSNKWSWLNDHYNSIILKEFFGNADFAPVLTIFRIAA
jgi:hypothetical protein